MELVHAITGSQATNGSLALGFGGAGLCVFFFGSNFVPVKKIGTGDGIFFQFIMCNAILFFGIIIQILRNSPKMYPFVMIGGAMWATGNVCVVPILKTIGLGLGILIWATVNMICGWACGRFGLFGTKAEVPANATFNYLGMALCACSAVLFLFIKPSLTDESTTEYQAFENGIQSQNEGPPFPRSAFQSSHHDSDESIDLHHSMHESILDDYDNNDTFSRLSALQKRIIGSVLAIISGALYGFSFSPAYYVRDNYKGASQEGLDYVFAQFLGIYVMSTAFLLIYAAFKRNEPTLFPKAVLSGYVSGIMWAIADTAWFVANQILGEAISFPIISAGPTLVATLWSIFLFKEIRGLKNFLILGSAFLVTGTGIAFTAISKQ